MLPKNALVLHKPSVNCIRTLSIPSNYRTFNMYTRTVAVNLKNDAVCVLVARWLVSGNKYLHKLFMEMSLKVYNKSDKGGLLWSC